MAKIPFEPLVKALVKGGMSESEALMVVQDRLDRFVAEKKETIQQFDIESNEASRQATSALITLATVLIPLTTLSFAQEFVFKMLSSPQRILICVALFLLFVSLIFGVISHWSGGAFFKKWASGTQAGVQHVNVNLNSMSATKEIYDKFDEQMIEEGLLTKDHKGTVTSSRLWDYLQFGAVILASIALFVTIYSILFDVPFWMN